MKCGYACRWLDALGQIFITFQAHSDSNLAMCRRGRRHDRTGIGPDNPKDPTFTANRHARTEGDLRGHADCEFDLRAFRERGIGEKEHSSRAQILSESYPLDTVSGLMKRNGKEVGK